ncbi:MAG: peptide-methionine (S)-S-oxide reductase MsrA [Tahibacter sp.]
MRSFSTCLLGPLLALAASLGVVNAAEPAPEVRPASSETLVLAGGCFWCLEAVFEELKGVASVDSGYAGGTVANPTYEQVSSGTTGHAESVRITFDPKVVSRENILRVFFTIHDPTTLNRQGADVGTQYRSVAFFQSPEQKASIDAVIAEFRASHEWSDDFVTQVIPLDKFYKAENYHQEYFALHGEEPYCQLVVGPKVAKFRKRFHDLRKS